MQKQDPWPGLILLALVLLVGAFSGAFAFNFSAHPFISGLFLVATMVTGILALSGFPKGDRLRHAPEVAVPAAICALFGFLTAPLIDITRTSGYGALCLENVAEIPKAMIGYAVDHDDHLPPTSAWQDLLHRNDGSLRCPATSAPYSYAMNSALSREKRSKLEREEETVLSFDCNAYAANPAGGEEWFARRHEGGGGIGFVDGHAKMIRGENVIWKPYSLR